MDFKYTTDAVPFAPKDNVDLDMRLLGFAAMNEFARHNSTPRQAMMTKQIGQMLVLDDPDIRRISSGIDRELGRYTFNVDFPNNSVVLKVIPKYPNSLKMQNIKTNPMTIVVYENADSANLIVDIKEIPSYHCIHQYFGFDFKRADRYNEYIRENANIPAGTIVADTPAKDRDGNYKYGVNLNVAFTSRPGGIEDSVTICEDVLDKLQTTLYDTRVIEFGTDKIPLNLYGNKSSFKIFPDVGDVIREDGVIAALRDFDNDLAPCYLTVGAMQTPTIFDERIYAIPGAEIVDVTIYKSKQSRTTMFTGMEEQLDKYLDAQNRYYKAIVDEYKRLMRESRGQVKISNEFHRLIKDAMAMTEDKIKVTYTDKNTTLDKWTVKITYKYKMKADIGYKITDLSGGKGVICAVKPRSEMLMNSDGVVADIEMDADSVANRMNPAKLYTQYINASGDKLRRDITAIVADGSEQSYLKAWYKLIGFYKIISPFQYNALADSGIDPISHVDHVVADGIYAVIRPDSEVNTPAMIKLLMEHYPATYGPCTYIGQTGRKITTKNPILIGELYFILLEKIATDFSAVSSAKLQHYGLPAKPTKRGKYADPIRTSPTRAAGEAEVRLFVATAGGEATADLLDRSTNPDVHRHIVKGILTADQPTNVYSYVDRKEFPVGQGTVLKLTNHIFNCAGIGFTKGDDPYDKQYARY